MIAEVSAFFVSHLFGGRLTALFCNTGVVIDAKLANM
jgi:hypothetical protein